MVNSERERIRALLDRIALDAIAPMSLGLGIYYAFLTVLHLSVDPPEMSVHRAASSGVTAATLLGLRAMLHRTSVARVHVFTALAAALVLGNSLQVLHLESDPRETTNLVLLVIAVACLFTSTFWFAVIQLTVGVGWLIVAAHWLPDLEWTHFGLALGASMILAVVIFMTRLAMIRRFEALRIQDEQRQQRLARVIEAEAEARAELEVRHAELGRALVENQQSQERFRTLSLATFEGIAIHEAGRILEVNENFSTMFSSSAEALVGRTVFDVLAPDARSRVASQVFSGTEQPLQVDGLRNGEKFPIEIRGRRIPSGSRLTSVSVVRDLTEIRRAEDDRVRAEVAERMNLELAAEVEERRERELALQTLTTELERSNRELQDFAYVASHDLREPLRKVQAFGERIEKAAATELGDRSRDYLARMRSAAARMEVLIDGLLEFSRVTTKAKPFKPTNLDRVAAGVLEDLASLVERTGGTVDLRPLPTVDADPLQMRQLLQNLVGNALKYHPSDAPPHVTVEGRTFPDRRSPTSELCQIVVRDEGIGFEPTEAERIFGVFQRLHGRREYEGTGIGLSICRKIAERHGGSIRAEGTPGEGATFTVTLPARHDVAAADGPAADGPAPDGPAPARASASG